MVTPDQLFFSLINAEVSAWNFLERALDEAKSPLSLGRFFLLRTVAQSPEPIRIQDVAHAQRITVGAASRLVDRLHRDGLLSRESDPTDRRATLLTVTPEGRAHLDRSRLVVEKAQNALFVDLSSAQRDALVDALALIDEAGAATVSPALSQTSAAPTAPNPAPASSK